MKLEIFFEDGRKESFDDVVSYQEVREPTINQELNGTLTPIMSCMVNPLAINRDLFKDAWKADCDFGYREKLRKLIQEAFVELDNNPEKYASPFYIVIPKKDWDDEKSVSELEQYAKDRGGYIADWVEQALTWAQRISNGDIWENVLRTPHYYTCNQNQNGEQRLVKKKPGYYYLVGGKYSWWANIDYHTPVCNSARQFDSVVPLVVFREKINFPLPSAIRF